MIRKFMIAALAAAALAAVAKPKPKAKIPFEKYTLSNGLEVILHEDRRLPLVTANVWYHVGAANERAGRSGFAHLFEHMMFQGSRHVGDDQHFGILESIGARGINGTTNFDRTNYFETVPRNELETMLWLESDRMGFLLDALSQAKLDNQREVVRNERRQRTDNRPYGRADERMVQLLYPQPHPYYGAVIGSHADLQAATLDDVSGFFKTYYAPNNATLVVAGDFDPAATKALIEKYFGTLPQGGPPPAIDARVQAPPDKEVREELTDSVQLARWSVGWIGPPAYAEGQADLDLLSTILGGSKSSRLYKKLVYDKKIAQNVTCWNDEATLGSSFGCDILIKPGATVADVEKEVELELTALRDKGPTQEEVKRAQTMQKAADTRALESGSRRADLLNRYNHFVGDPGFFEKDQARYAAVTPRSIQTQAKKWLDARRVIVIVKPEGK